jgi:hypothetical protein
MCFIDGMMHSCIDDHDGSCISMTKCHRIIPCWIDVKMTHYCLVMVDREVQMDELQSGPLMVKSLTGRHFAVELS